MPADPLYGRRSDGTPRDPWHSVADARALGYSSPFAFRVSHGEKARPLATVREIAGHGGKRYTISFVNDRGELVAVHNLSYADAKRGGRIAAEQGRVARNQADRAAYERRAAKMAPIGGEKPAADLDDLEAGISQTEPDDWDFES